MRHRTQTNTTQPYSATVARCSVRLHLNGTRLLYRRGVAIVDWRVTWVSALPYMIYDAVRVRAHIADEIVGTENRKHRKRQCSWHKGRLNKWAKYPSMVTRLCIWNSDGLRTRTPTSVHFQSRGWVPFQNFGKSVHPAVLRGYIITYLCRPIAAYKLTCIALFSVR